MPPQMIDKKLLSWATDIEQNTIQQALRSSRLPFVEGHIALMPDAHLGAGCTVGSVVPTLGAIVPSFVGVDIGCGMIAVETNVRADQLPDDLQKLHSAIAKAVPAGVGKGHVSGDLPKRFERSDFGQKEASKAINQFGTLGSGNHFVEVCVDEKGQVWIVLHSGSRGIGHSLAQHHIKIAKGLMKQWMIQLEDPDLAYLVQGTPEFDAYIADMRWAQAYAMANREAMMDAVLTAFIDASGYVNTDAREIERINCHHNFTQLEHFGGKDVWVTRKGAIKAAVGDRGIIPGSMATNTYIVSGLGNAASYNSCAHGAGRCMSRSQAKRELSVDSLREAMAGKAWNGSTPEASWAAQAGQALLDEHPDSYKDIERVMAAQSDLVSVDHVLNQVLNYKG